MSVVLAIGSYLDTEMTNQMVNNKLQIGHGKRKPSQFAIGSIQHILYDRSLCAMRRTIQYIVNVANKSYTNK